MTLKIKNGIEPGIPVQLLTELILARRSEPFPTNDKGIRRHWGALPETFLLLSIRVFVCVGSQTIRQFHQHFTRSDPKSAKNGLIVLFALLGSACVKAERKILIMPLKPLKVLRFEETWLCRLPKSLLNCNSLWSALKTACQKSYRFLDVCKFVTKGHPDYIIGLPAKHLFENL